MNYKNNNKLNPKEMHSVQRCISTSFLCVANQQMVPGFRCHDNLLQSGS